MAEKLDSFPKKESNSYEKYDRFLNGEAWKITKEDFPNHSNLTGIRSTFIRRAKTLGIRIKTVATDNGEAFIVQKISDNRDGVTKKNRF